MIRVSVAIMAVAARAEMVDELRATLDRPATVAWDRQQIEWETGRRAWLDYDRDATHHLVLQDDAVVCRDLCAGLEQAISVVGDVPISLYLGQPRPYPSRIERTCDAADGAAAAWITMHDLHWGVGIVMPTVWIERMVRDQDRRPILEYDRRISHWFKRQAQRVWYAWPCLVDHREGPSMLGHSTDRRCARRFIGADVSALTVDWAAGMVPMPDPRRDHITYPRRVSRRPVITLNDSGGE